MTRSMTFRAFCMTLIRRQHSWLLFSFLLILSAAPCLRADVIWLKNGKQIVARVTHMDGTRVFYERSGTKSSVPLTEVDRVDSYSSPSDEAIPSQDAAASPGLGARRPAV